MTRVTTLMSAEGPALHPKMIAEQTGDLREVHPNPKRENGERG